MINYGDKLYVICRRDLSNGSKAVQGMHALAQFALDHNSIFLDWTKQSNYLCFLEVSSEQQLTNLIKKANKRGIRYSEFFEPDLGFTLTAIALEPGEKSKKLCKKLILAYSI